MTVSVGGETYSQQLSGNYAGEPFLLSEDPVGGTLVTVACFGRGTRILTDRGEVAVENLHVGDLVQTVLDSGLAPIIWIGHRRIDCARHTKPRQVWPVHIAADAFGPERPHTALVLSPDHAVYINKVLIPVKHLINGSTIAQLPAEQVTYYHVELPRHEVLLAQGLPVESYLDTGARSNFVNGGAAIRLFPDFATHMWEARGCAPLIVTGPEFSTVRALVENYAAAGNLHDERGAQPGRRRSRKRGPTPVAATR